jgi:crotonobetainyl-CoA:carnitine CoA-transferase CaiB-like acyl-CoA transferase
MFRSLVSEDQDNDEASVGPAARLEPGRRMSSDVAGPLSGIRVCDVTQNLAGPFCGQILADLGATVIKVEPPGGDLGRAWGPPFWGGESTLFLSANRGKRSIVLDLKNEGGLGVLERLAKSCDVFLQASRPGVADRIGMGYASVRRWREDVIYMSVSAYGQKGPMREQPGYDPLMQAFSGMMSVTGHPDAPPTRAGGSVIDFGTGMWAAIAILGALRTRDATGQGAELEAALLDTALSWISYHMMGCLATGQAPGPGGSSLGSIAPYRAFQTADGYVMISAGNDRIFERLCAALGLDGLIKDTRFATNPDRVANREALDLLIEACTVKLPTDEALDLTRRHAVPASAINDISQVLSDPQVTESGMVPSTPHPEIPDYRDLSIPLRINADRPRADAPPPSCGADTREILAELGYSGAEVARLVETGSALVSEG